MKVTCDVNDLSNELDAMFKMGRKQEREMIVRTLNALVEEEPLSSERNGIILALNTIHEMGEP